MRFDSVAIITDPDENETSEAAAMKAPVGVKVLKPNLGNGFDANKAAQMGKIVPFMNDLQEVERPNLESKPAPKPDTKPVAFPADCFPFSLRKVAKEIRRIVQAPEALVYVSTLAAATATVQGLADIHIDGRRIAVCLDIVLNGQSGERKSAVDKLTQRPLNEVNQERYARFCDKQQRAEAIEEKKKKGPKPGFPSRVMGEGTVEGMMRLFAEGSADLLWSSDEAGAFFGGYSFGDDRQIRTAAAFSRIWDGSPIQKSTAGGGTITLYNRRLTLNLAVQPVILRDVIGNEFFFGQGLGNRILFCDPGSTIGNRPYNNENVAQAPPYQAYCKRVKEITELYLDELDNRRADYETRIEKGVESEDGWRPGECLLHRIELSPDAKQAYIDFYNEIEGRSKQGEDLREHSGYAAKIAEQAVRIAGVFWVFESYGKGDTWRTIPEESMQAGIRLARYFLDELLRLREQSIVDERIEQANILKGWLREHNKGGLVYSGFIRQYGPTFVRRSGKNLEELMAELVENGSMEVEQKTVIDGSMRSKVWRVIKK